jgi:hypothetical protein
VRVDLITVRGAPALPAPAPWCAAFLDYGADGPTVAVLWWDDRPYSERAARLVGEAGALDEGILGPDVDLPEAGWHWWIVGEEVPWSHDPRIAIASVTAAGPATPAVALAGLMGVLAEAPEPTFSAEQAREQIARRLPWVAAEGDLADLLQEGGRSIGSGTVLSDPEGER